VTPDGTAFVAIEHPSRVSGAPPSLRNVPTPEDVARRLYDRWNESGVAALTDSVTADVELVADPLLSSEPQRGMAAWNQWVARWEDGYEHVHITPDALVPLDDTHVLALVSITATPTGAAESLTWAAAHVWTVRDERIAGWQAHLDLDAARNTLDQ
jgi:ketosteroid isomerase-like protein